MARPKNGEPASSWLAEAADQAADDGYLPVPAAAKAMQVEESTVRQLIDARLVETVTFGEELLVRPADVSSIVPMAGDALSSAMRGRRRDDELRELGRRLTHG